MWRRRSWFSLKGKAGIPGQERSRPATSARPRAPPAGSVQQRVEGEVTRSLDEERERQQVVLFPIRLDDVVMQTPKPWTRLLRGQRHVGDFTRWKDHDAYRKSFERLVRDLTVQQTPKAP